MRAAPAARTFDQGVSRARARVSTTRSTLIELGEAENDQATIAEAGPRLSSLRSEARRQEVEALLSGEADGNDAYLEVHAGAGGTESQDWAAMLVAHVHALGRAARLQGRAGRESAGEEAGIKSATLQIKGENAYGWLKTEFGRASARAHLAVRLQCAPAHELCQRLGLSRSSTTTSTSTSRRADCRIDTYRCARAARRPARQHDRLGRAHHRTCRPTSCWSRQDQRSQHQEPRGDRLKRLKARLYELELKKREEKAAAEAACKTDIGWGHQIRSYVLQPYQMVKDLRTGVQTSDTSGVLDGDIDAFIEAALAQRMSGARARQGRGHRLVRRTAHLLCSIRSVTLQMLPLR